MDSKIDSIRATPVRVPAKPDSLNSPGIEETDVQFAARFRTGGSWTDFPLEIKWIVELRTAGGQRGCGETYRGVTAEELQNVLPGLLGLDVLKTNWRRLPCSAPRAYDAVETAVLDLAGRLLGVPIHQLLGGAVRDRIECSGWTGRRTPADAGRKAAEALARGHRVFKFKCAAGDNLPEWFAAIRERCGDQIKILLDPNQRWSTVDGTRQAMAGVPREMMFGLEDPIDRQDYAGYRTLREELKVPMLLHVSLPYAHQGQRAEDVLRALPVVDGFNFNGPMFGFLRLAAVAELAGLTCWHGSEVDLGLLEVSALHAAAAAANCTIPSDLFGELVRENDLIEPGIRWENGHALVPNGPGLGVELDDAAVARYQAGETYETR